MNINTIGLDLLRKVIQRSTIRSAVYVAILATASPLLLAFQPFILASATVAIAQGTEIVPVLGAYVSVGVLSGIFAAGASYFSLRSRERIGGDIAAATLVALLRPDKSFWRHSLDELSTPIPRDGRRPTPSSATSSLILYRLSPALPFRSRLSLYK